MPRAVAGGFSEEGGPDGGALVSLLSLSELSAIVLGIYARQKKLFVFETCHFQLHDFHFLRGLCKALAMGKMAGLGRFDRTGTSREGDGLP